MAEQWLSIVEYARGFSISDMTVRRRIKTGKLKAVLKDGKYYIPVSQLPENQQLQFKNNRFVHYPADIGQDKDLAASPVGALSPSQGASGKSFETDYAPTPRPVTNPAVQRSGGGESTQSLIHFCEQSLDRVEASVKNAYQARLEAKQSQIRSLELELTNAKQEIDDLKMLVKIFEQKLEKNLPGEH